MSGKFLENLFNMGIKEVKILVTTRSDKVAFVMQTISAYRLSLLPEEDCWSMFVKHAFLSIESRQYSTLEQIGRKIVTRCKGLPLAVESLGGLLRTNYAVNYWDNILKSEIWKIPEERIIPALRISYHYLPSHLKQCFVYCSLYPKDYQFSKEEMIMLWMAENFVVQPNGIMTLEEIGCQYFNELVARSFFQPSNIIKGFFVMHDLMHDLATFCAGEFYFRDELENAIEIGKVSIKTRHLSHNAIGNYPISKVVAVCNRAKHIRTFLEVNPRTFIVENAPYILLSNLKCLRVLSFNSFPLHSLPDSVCELIHLRYLDLSHTPLVTLPGSFNNLYNLQTLKLNDCPQLKMLPSGMQDLVNLHHLDIRRTYLEDMPKGISKMKHLQFLSYYIVGKHEENKIRELGPLVTLHGSLEISNLENVVNSDEASEARMIDKKHINCLALKWSTNSNIADSRFERDILDKLRPHEGLERLSIVDYQGTILPDWFGYSSYQNMSHMTLYGCENCCMLPSLGQLPSLKQLNISLFGRLVSIGDEFYKSNQSSHWETPFQSLETLKFYGLDCWWQWHSFEFDDAFPQLKELTIEGCPMLIGDFPNHLLALEKLSIDRGCKQLACSLPRAPAMLELKIPPMSKLRMQELPLSLPCLSFQGNHLVESVLEAMSHTQSACLQSLHISDCDSAISFPRDCLPSSLQSLRIERCKKLDFPLQQQQQHESLRRLTIFDSCDSLTSFPLNAFPNLTNLIINGCEKMKSLVVSQSHNTAISSLRSLRICECPSFVSFSTLWMAAPQLESFDIWGCPKIDSFPGGCFPPSLRDVGIASCEKLESWLASMDLRCHGLTRLSIGIESESVKSFPKESWLPTFLESLSLQSSPSLETLDCNGLSHLTSLRSLYISYCDKLENMTGERLPACLTHLNIYDCPLLGERVKDPQIWPKISHIPHIQVDEEQIS